MIAKHMIRTLMIETPSVPGNLGRVATAVGVLGGDIGEVETVKVGPNYTMRNITVQVENEEQLQEVIAAVQASEKGSGFTPYLMKSCPHMKAEKSK